MNSPSNASPSAALHGANLDAEPSAAETLRYAQATATQAATLYGPPNGWAPLGDVYGCLSQIDNALCGLQRKPREHVWSSDTEEHPYAPPSADAMLAEVTVEIERLVNPIDRSMIREIYNDSEADDIEHDRDTRADFLKRIRRVMQMEAARIKDLERRLSSNAGAISGKAPSGPSQ